MMVELESAKRGICRGCDKEIWWIVTVKGHYAPYDGDGISHFATCPQAPQFRRKRNGEQRHQEATPDLPL